MTKEFVLAEIRRVAAELGHAPGRGEFLARTGIKHHEVAGRFWVTWGDALSEAGFEPNKLNVAFSDEYVTERLALLTRELGHFPRMAEVRIKRRYDATFPTHTVFSKIGTAALVKRVREYCETHEGFDDVAQSCGAVAERPQVHGKTQSEESGAALVNGHVYMIRAGRNQYKIGRTNSPTRRHREVSVNLPYATELVHSIATDDPAGIEAYWHKRFEEKRIPGTEFFKLGTADTAAFKRRKFM